MYYLHTVSGSLFAYCSCKPLSYNCLISLAKYTHSAQSPHHLLKHFTGYGKFLLLFSDRPRHIDFPWLLITEMVKSDICWMSCGLVKKVQTLRGGLMWPKGAVTWHHSSGLMYFMCKNAVCFRWVRCRRGVGNKQYVEGAGQLQEFFLYEFSALGADAAEHFMCFCVHALYKLCLTVPCAWER